MTRLDHRGRNDARELARVRLLVFAEIDDLDVLAAAVRVSKDEPLLGQPGERRFRAFVGPASIDLEVNPPRAIFEAPFPIGKTPKPLEDPRVQRIRCG